MENSERIGEYELVKPLGSGSFGTIQEALWRGRRVALKIERTDNLKPMLKLEYEVMDALKGTEGFPQVYEYLEQPDKNLMSMQVLSRSLEDIFKEHKNVFDIRTALEIMMQVLSRIEAMHAKGYLYRDVKPSNFMIGEDPKLIYVIDFGLCKKYNKQNCGSHIPERQNKKLVGTPLFCSIYTHQGLEQSRRDDLESLAYMILYFLRPLPWENIKEEDKQVKYELIKQVKTKITEEELFKDLPRELVTYLKYCKKLQFDDKPDYAYLRQLIRCCRRYQRDSAPVQIRPRLVRARAQKIASARQLFLQARHQDRPHSGKPLEPEDTGLESIRGNRHEEERATMICFGYLSLFLLQLIIQMADKEYSDSSEAEKIEEEMVSGMKENQENQESESQVYVAEDNSRSQSQSQSSVNSSASFQDLEKYCYKKGEIKEEVALKPRRSHSQEAVKIKEAKPEKQTKPKKSKPKKKISRKKKGQLSQGQRLVAEQQCKQIFQRLIDTMNRQNRIDQTSLRNGLERFTKKCDLEKLIPLMNILDPDRQPPKQTLSFEDFRLIFMRLQYDIDGAGSA